MTFSLTPKQRDAQALIAGIQTYTMLFGGSRSGKTFLIVRAIVIRALAAPGSRHLIARFRFNAVVQSIGLDTLPKVMSMCFPGVPYKWNDKMGYFDIGPRGSEIWLAGLDDKERTEKILGLEFATIYPNECSQIPWSSIGLLITRLAQVVMVELEGEEKRPLTRRMAFDCNPPNKGHWTYKLFIQKRDPETGLALSNGMNYAAMQINPGDNQANLPADYVQTLQGLSARLQRRFLQGEFADANPNALFREEDIDIWRHEGDRLLPDFIRVVVAVDPSGSGDADNADNDAIGIVVAAIGTDGNAYVLEDATVKAGPKTWGDVATSAYDRHSADVIVGEINFGGAMVNHVIQASRPRTNYKTVTASRGKAVRAEPFSALYENGKVRHVGQFRELEDELTAFSTFGYTGEGSPNRADALIWALTELFPGLVSPRKEKKKEAQLPNLGAGGWMA